MMEILKLVRAVERMEVTLKTVERMEVTLQSVCSRLVAIEEMQKVLYDRVNEGLHSRQASWEMPAVEPSWDLPFEYWEELTEVMDKMKDANMKEQLITHLSKVGGKDLTAVVNKIMYRLMSNDLASKCNWKGRGGVKYALDKTPLLYIVHGAVVRHVGRESTTEEIVKGRIQDWLKQATRRANRVLNRDQD